MPKFTIDISKSAIHFIHTIKFNTSIDESRIIYLMIKHFKNNPEELEKILHHSNIFDKRTNEIIEDMEKNDNRIRQNKLYKRGIKNVYN